MNKLLRIILSVVFAASLVFASAGFSEPYEFKYKSGDHITFGAYECLVVATVEDAVNIHGKKYDCYILQPLAGGEWAVFTAKTVEDNDGPTTKDDWPPKCPEPPGPPCEE